MQITKVFDVVRRLVVFVIGGMIAVVFTALVINNVWPPGPRPPFTVRERGRDGLISAWRKQASYQDTQGYLLGVDEQLNSVVLIESNSSTLVYWPVGDRIHFAYRTAEPPEVSFVVDANTYYRVTAQFTVEKVKITDGVAAQIQAILPEASQGSWASHVTQVIDEARN